MFDISLIDRDMPRDQWVQLYQIIRRVGDRGSLRDESRLADRARLAAKIADCIEDGAICVVESGRDCDCVEFVHSSITRNPTTMKLWADREDRRYWADGPLHVGFCRPSERPGNYSRDLAMEAYENGHPHFITAATV